LRDRQISVDQVIARLRPQLAKVPGAPVVLQAIQDLRIGGRGGRAQYQYTLQGVGLGGLDTWGPPGGGPLGAPHENSGRERDPHDKGLPAVWGVDRDTT